MNSSIVCPVAESLNELTTRLTSPLSVISRVLTPSSRVTVKLRASI